MSSNRGTTTFPAKSRQSKADQDAEEARLDALIAGPSKPSGQQGKSVMASRLDKPRTDQKSVMPSRLDNTRQDQKSVMLSRLDKSATEKSKLSPKLDDSRLEKSKLPSRLDESPNYPKITKLGQVTNEIMALRLDNSYQKVEERQIRTPTVNAAFTNLHDVEMASRQTKYDTLSPAEQQKQEAWAQQKIRATGVCPAGFHWIRVPGGYNCAAGAHWISDELVAEGRGRFYGIKIFTGPDRYSAIARAHLGRDNPREIGFSQGLEQFDGPHEFRDRFSWRNPSGRGFGRPNQNLQQAVGNNQFRWPDQNQQQGLFNPYSPIGNNPNPSAFGKGRFGR